MTKVSLDLGLALSPRVAGGVDERSVLAHERAHLAVPGVLARVRAGELGFWGLPDEAEAAASARALAERLRARFEKLVVFGIGGSSLGGRMLVEALAPTGADRVHFVDNVDPFTFDALLSELDLERTCFNVISKSGGTVETAAQFVVVRDLLRARFGDAGYRERVVATTDPDQGLMHEIAIADGLERLPIPGNVGGRFSVLTAVGLLPAAFAEVDVEALTAGARSMRARCTPPEVDQNPALAHAVLHHLADTKLRRSIHVVMPYADRLRAFGEWYCQLWGESLGKALDRGGARVHVGPTPVVALGATDQHSQLQLYAEGPEDKLVTFLAVEDPGSEVPFPRDMPEGYGYLAGHTMRGLLDAERRGTALALARLGRPSATIHIERIDAFALGALVFFYEASTAFSGELYDIDAFDQPGVEMGKRIAFGLMGRAGYEDALAGLERWNTPDPRWTFAG